LDRCRHRHLVTLPQAHCIRRHARLLLAVAADIEQRSLKKISHILVADIASGTDASGLAAIQDTGHRCLSRIRFPSRLESLQGRFDMVHVSLSPDIKAE